MGLFKRMSDIVSANLSEMMDNFEDPETMLKQAVREMEIAIGSAMDAAAKSIADEKLLSKQLEHHRSQAGQWRKRAAEVVGQDDETARHALRRRSDHLKLAAAVDDQLAAARTTNEKLRRQIDAMRIRLNEAKQKLASLIARKRTAEVQKRLAARSGDFESSDEAFHKFDRMCEKIEFAEAEAEALIELAAAGGLFGASVSLAVENLDADIEAELQKLKNERESER